MVNEVGQNEIRAGWESFDFFWLSLMRLGSKYRRLWTVCYLSTSCINVKCRSFRVLTKALLQSRLGRVMRKRYLYIIDIIVKGITNRPLIIHNGYFKSHNISHSNYAWYVGFSFI